MFRSAHIWIKRLFISLVLLLNLSFLCTIRDIDILLSWDFNVIASSVMDLAVWLAVLSKLRSLVTQCEIIWSGLKSRTLGLTWWCMHLTFAELNGRTLTRHLWLSFLVNKKQINFLKTVSLEFCDGGGNVISLLVVLFLLLLLLSVS